MEKLPDLTQATEEREPYYTTSELISRPILIEDLLNKPQFITELAKGKLIKKLIHNNTFYNQLVIELPLPLHLNRNNNQKKGGSYIWNRQNPNFNLKKIKSMSIRTTKKEIKL